MHKALCGEKAEIHRNMNLILQLTEYIELSLLPKLSKSYDESKNHSEYDVRLRNIDNNFLLVLKLLEEVNLRDKSGAVSSILSTLFIMYKELQSEGPWNNKRSKEFAFKLNSRFQHLYKISLDDVFKKNDTFNSQDIFDKCVDNLHRKLTVDDFKKYPGRINVYCTLIQDFQEYNVKFNSISTFPITLLLIDDYIVSNKIQGLKCCRSLLKSLSIADFQSGNYYEVIYGSLYKTMNEKDLEVTMLSHHCCLKFIHFMPPAVKAKKLNDLYSSILEETSLESNVRRKEVCIKFLKNVIELYGVNCVKGKKLFMAIAYDNLDTCTSYGTKGVLAYNILQSMLECLEEWIRNCWCVWKLSSDQKLLSLLIKILYITCNEDNNRKIVPEKNIQVLAQLHNIIVSLISLCSKEEKVKIAMNLEKSSQVPNKDFLKRIEMIQKEISI